MQLLNLLKQDAKKPDAEHIFKRCDERKRR
jgi:hypothetical protein